MSAKDELTLEVSLLKALLYSSAVTVAVWGFGVLFAVWDGFPFNSPIFVSGFVILVVIGTPVFTAILVLLISCPVGPGGIRSLFYGELGWNEMSYVQPNPLAPYYMIRGRGLFCKFCMVPRRFLLKDPDQLWEAVNRYAPRHHFLRSRLKR